MIFLLSQKKNLLWAGKNVREKPKFIFDRKEKSKIIKSWNNCLMARRLEASTVKLGFNEFTAITNLFC